MVRSFRALGPLLAVVLVLACSNEPAANLGPDAGSTSPDVVESDRDGDTRTDGADPLSDGGGAGDDAGDGGPGADGGDGDATDGDGSTDGGGDPPDTGPEDATVVVIDGSIPPAPDGGTFALTPAAATLQLGQTQRFEVTAPAGSMPIWSVDTVLGGEAATGTIAANPANPLRAIYTAPFDANVLPRSHEVTALLESGETAVARVDLIHPAPSITSMVPSALAAGAAAMTVVITGSGFTSATRAELDGVLVTARRTSFFQLQVDLPATLLAFAGERRLTLTNPAPGGGTDTEILLLVLDRNIVGPGVDARIPLLFDAATAGNDAARRPAITYPQDASEAPLDFPAPAVSFTLPAPSNVCRIRYGSDTVQVDHFVNPTNRPVSANPSGTLTPAEWAQIIQSSNTLHELRIEVSCAEVVVQGGVPSIATNTIHTSAPVRYSITRESAGGRIVYFSGLIAGLWRIDIGGLNATGAPWIGPDASFRLNTTTCVGCHSFSSNGGRMSYATYLNDQWEIGTVNVLNDTPTNGFVPGPGEEAVWTAIHPSGNWILSTNVNRQTRLLDAATGQLLGVAPTGGLDSTLAVWAPDGGSFAYVTGTEANDGVTDFAGGVIWTMSFSMNGTTPVFGAPVQLVGPDVMGGTAYYPFYSPDGQWIVFCRAPSGSAYNNPGAELWMIRANGAGGPVRLANANMGPNLTNSWPRWAPSYGPDRYWLIFSSQRPYPPLIGTGPQQLWVTHIDATRFPNDPSMPAIWLSGQEPFTGNLTAEWTAAQ